MVTSCCLSPIIAACILQCLRLRCWKANTALWHKLLTFVLCKWCRQYKQVRIITSQRETETETETTHVETALVPCQNHSSRCGHSCREIPRLSIASSSVAQELCSVQQRTLCVCLLEWSVPPHLSVLQQTSSRRCSTFLQLLVNKKCHNTV